MRNLVDEYDNSPYITLHIFWVPHFLEGPGYYLKQLSIETLIYEILQIMNFWGILNSLQSLQSVLYCSLIKIKYTLQKLKHKPPGPV